MTWLLDVLAFPPTKISNYLELKNSAFHHFCRREHSQETEIFSEPYSISKNQKLKVSLMIYASELIIQMVYSCSGVRFCRFLFIIIIVIIIIFLVLFYLGCGVAYLCSIIVGRMYFVKLLAASFYFLSVICRS